jgi:hypothetical protein
VQIKGREAVEEKDKKPATKEEQGLGLKVLYQPSNDLNTIVE